MNEIVKEFICFLENKKNWLEQILRNNVQKKAMVQIDDQIVTIKSIEDIVEEIKIIIRFLSQTLEGEVKEKEIYNSFETLSNFLIQMPYDSIKKTKIIFFVIEKNNNLLKLAPKTQVTILDINKLYDYYKNRLVRKLIRLYQNYKNHIIIQQI